MSMIRNLKRMIRKMIQEELAVVHTHMPAKVISYDADQNTCSVQPCINRLRVDDPNNTTTVQLPVLEDVPVKQFGSGACLLSIAPQAGSYGLLHIAERDIVNWLNSGGVVDPGSVRKFDISDAFFDPGIYPVKVDGNNGKVDVDINADRIELRTRTGDTFVSVVDDETIAMEAGGTTIDVDATGNITISMPAAKTFSVDGNLTVTSS